MRLADIAKLFLHVRETPAGSNAGYRVEAIQRWGGCSKGDPWCAAFVSLVIDLAYAGTPPLPRTASCDVLLEHARKRGWLQQEPAPGDVFLVMRAPHDAVHTGIVAHVAPGQFTTIEGNASDPTKPATREGWGVFERTRRLTLGTYQFIRLPSHGAPV